MNAAIVFSVSSFDVSALFVERIANRLAAFGDSICVMVV